jgi:hypothetical protein
MIENWKNAVDDKYCAAVVAVSEMLTRLICDLDPLFPLPLYDFLILIQLLSFTAIAPT